MHITSSGRCQGEAPGTREPTSEPNSWYVWTRDFASEEQREELYKKVYGSDYWTNEVAPLVPECIDPEGILVERIVPCDDFPEGIGAENARRGGGFGGMADGDESFYELRQYPILPGKMDEWVKVMEEKVIPFQRANGMIVTSSSRGETDDSVYIWTRKFLSEEHRAEAYEAVYQSDYWVNEIGPTTPDYIDRPNISVLKFDPTPKWSGGI